VQSEQVWGAESARGRRGPLRIPARGYSGDLSANRRMFAQVKMDFGAGAAWEIRTPDLLITSEPLYRLS
jgi:hypothetical protein